MKEEAFEYNKSAESKKKAQEILDLRPRDVWKMEKRRRLEAGHLGEVTRSSLQNDTSPFAGRRFRF